MAKHFRTTDTTVVFGHLDGEAEKNTADSLDVSFSSDFSEKNGPF
jgi:hypothetical protein